MTLFYVQLYLPKVEQNYSLNDVLKCMSINKVLSKKADLSGINGFGRFYLVMHKVIIQVNEMGIEAATTGQRMVHFPGPPPHPVFKVNHLFLYLLRDNRSCIILFLGQVNNP